MKKKTLKDIADILGVSTTTISRVLNDKPDVSDLTRQKVKKLFKAFDYHPDMLARNLRQHKSGIIGVIVPRLTHYFFSTAFSGILKIANKKGYSIILFESRHDLEKEQKYIDRLVSNNVDGILISLSNNTKLFNHFQKVKSYHIPIVLFDNMTNKDFEASKVIVDDIHSAFIAVEYLINKGRKRIACITGTKYATNLRRRLSGYFQALKKYQLPIHPELILECKKVNEKAGYNLTQNLLTISPRPDAIFTVTDEVAIGVIKALKEKKINIPEEVAVMGFSNSILSTVITPQLSTVLQPSKEMGKKAIKVLIDTIENKKKEVTTTILKTKLIIRDSA